jgi:acetyltransferase-like isoleucine patch superfamily enzyme
VRVFLRLILIFLPWALRRVILQGVFGYSLHPTSRLGRCWIYPKHLTMGEHSQIGDLTVCKGIDLLSLGPHASIGRLNWITGFPRPSIPGGHFWLESDRRPELILAEHSAITNRHIVDCTNSITIGKFSTFAGFRSQMLTHSIDLSDSQQKSAPVRIGEYCFIGTACVILPGASLPDRCVLAAGSVLHKQQTVTDHLYGGVPAVALKRLEGASYFSRQMGFVI